MDEINLSAPRYLVTVTRGDAWSLPLTFPRDPGAVAAQLRVTADADEFITLDVSTPVQDADKWRFHVGQTTATTSGVFDVQITEPGALPRTYFAAKLSLTPDVTR